VDIDERIDTSVSYQKSEHAEELSDYMIRRQLCYLAPH